MYDVEVMISLEQFHQSSPSMVGFHSRSEIHIHMLSGNRLSFDGDKSKKIKIKKKYCIIMGMELHLFISIVQSLSS